MGPISGLNFGRWLLGGEFPEGEFFGGFFCWTKGSKNSTQEFGSNNRASNFVSQNSAPNSGSGGAYNPLCRNLSASPKPHPSKPRPCNMPQAKTEVALQFSECYAAETALQHWLFCSAEVIWTKSCAAANKKLHCNIEKAALQESGAFLPLSCGFQAPTFRHPRFGPAEFVPDWLCRGPFRECPLGRCFLIGRDRGKGPIGKIPKNR